MEFLEIDEGAGYIGYRDALALVYSNVQPVGIEGVAVDLGVGRTVAEDLVALVNNPSVDVSLKDGFAVRSVDVVGASREQPACLRVIGSVFAGAHFEGEVLPGTAVRLCSGSPLPAGADAVVAGEFCEEAPGQVYVRADAGNGRNVLRAGEDIKSGAVIAEKGRVLLPGCLGLIAAAGIHTVRVYRKPRVTLIAVGDEIVAPGGHLRPGQLYASNVVTIASWLAAFGVPYDTAVVGDSRDAIRRELVECLPEADVILTSGGAWGSERDLVVGTLDELGWEKLFHHVRMGPGKALAFGICREKPVFCLPGGPASNEMAFLQLALPGILRMGGHGSHPLQTVPARLTEGVESRHRAWTEFRDATLSCDAAGNYLVTPYHNRSRLQAIASATGLICIPEGVARLSGGEVVAVQVLVPAFGGLAVAG